MSTGLMYALAGAALWLMGLLGVALQAHLLRRLMAFNMMGSGAFLVLVGLSRGADGAPDPVAQALVLTGIVVAVAATALAVVLMRRWFHLTGEVSLERDPE